MLANKRVPSEDIYFSPVEGIGCGLLGGKMDGWCALKWLLGLGEPRLDVRGGAESRDAGVRGVSFSPGCGTEDI